MRIEIDPETDCWIWQGALSPAGYGSTSLFGHRDLVHRVSYQLFVGPILAGHQIHHSCRNRACVNPQHLSALPEAEHHKGHNPMRDTCIWGHPFDARNTYVRANGQRQCRKCKARRERERQRRLRARATAAP